MANTSGERSNSQMRIKSAEKEKFESMQMSRYATNKQCSLIHRKPSRHQWCGNVMAVSGDSVLWAATSCSSAPLPKHAAT
jgi:hypothetical protein